MAVILLCLLSLVHGPSSSAQLGSAHTPNFFFFNLGAEHSLAKN